MIAQRDEHLSVICPTCRAYCGMPCRGRVDKGWGYALVHIRRDRLTRARAAEKALTPRNRAYGMGCRQCGANIPPTPMNGCPEQGCPFRDIPENEVWSKP